MAAGRPNVHKLPRAALDLIDIWVYIGKSSPENADRFLDVLEEKLRLLAEVPGLGRARPDLAANLRGFPFGDYHIFYRPVGQGIEVVRVLHGARDIDALFHDSLTE